MLKLKYLLFLEAHIYILLQIYLASCPWEVVTVVRRWQKTTLVEKKAELISKGYVIQNMPCSRADKGQGLTSDYPHYNRLQKGWFCNILRETAPSTTKG